MLTKPKSRQIAIALAFTSVVAPISGLHKFYLNQPTWGVVYLLLSLFTPIPRIASAIEGFWYLTQANDDFEQNFNLSLNHSLSQSAAQTTVPKAAASAVDPSHISAIAEAVRQLDQLRQDGLISEYEFEQKRRQLLDTMT
jgi:TM2 domain-containing membrane protein YozV